MGHRRRGLSADTILQGVLIVDKPAGLTSHAVCQEVKSALRVGKVGHGGTLDPFATGLLPLLINGATRLMPFIQSRDKVYEATIRLGVRTDTMDPTGEITAEADASHLSDEAIATAVTGFLGAQKQLIPRFSAARVEGKHLYEYARAGEEVEQPTKDIEIFALEISEVRRQGTVVDVDLTVHCGAGTYVRALADDLGERLQVGGHLAMLRRTRVDRLDLAEGVSMEALVAQSNAWRAERTVLIEAGEKQPFLPERNARTWREWLGGALRPVASVLPDVAVLRVDGPTAHHVTSGGALRKSGLTPLESFGSLVYGAGDRVLIEHPDGHRGVALVRAVVASAAMDRVADDAVVFEVERVLR